MSVLLPRKPSRRGVLRGTLGGLSASVALPFLDCFLDNSGKALAATGAPVPVRFGTWFWGLGHTPGHAITPKTTTSMGVEYLDECAPLIPHAKHITYFGGFNMPLDGRSNYTHTTGWIGVRAGGAPAAISDSPGPTIDLQIADVIGTGTRFQTIDASACNLPRENYSARSANSRSAAEVSPIALYARLFGPDFVDPNKADFKPDPAVMLHRSVLSAVGEQSKDFINTLGKADTERLDEYFTSIRQIENQLALQLEKPAPSQACRVPAMPDPEGLENKGLDIDVAIETHKIMSQLLAMAAACNQTKVTNMMFSGNQSSLHRGGETFSHHNLTHEEPTSPQLGYQPESHWFGCRSMEALATYIEAFASVREGDGSLLDNMLIFASSESSYARIHSLDGIPIMFIGKAGGRTKPGLHVAGKGDPITRVGLTAMQIMGVQIENWGFLSLRTGKSISEVMA